MFHPDGPSFFELARQALSSTAGGYDLLAPKFDLTPFRTPDTLIAATLDRLGSQEVDAAIDLCCGTGSAIPRLRRLCRGRVVGVDFSSGMLAEARRHHGGLPQVEFVQGDVLEVDLPGRFQLACCFGALGHFLDHPRLVRTVARLLDPGGRFAFLASEQPPFLSRRHLLSRGFNGIMRVRNALLKPPFVMYYLTFLLPRCARLLEDHGFSVRVESGGFERPLQDLKIVVATRK